MDIYMRMLEHITVLLLIVVLFKIYKKYQRLTEQFEKMDLEQSKMNFRLFVVEKKQKIYSENNGR